ncbi:hypothetical protein [Hymenobacter algoricola]|uniref:RHS repeat-associated core domain-containing protein n=1 Tax=Hymenobacter algoricola TaxID=486267 RepID=A0ABP7NEJ8_9BACT
MDEDPAFGELDLLRYKYNGNQLTGVDDLASSPGASPLPHDFEDNGHKYIGSSVAVDEYRYDASGNLTSDVNKGIASITYNQLNLPQVITFTNNNIIRFAYTAAGTKVNRADS